ncbi:hypothetical protein ACS5PN_13210 [Roseateles sp. NT4]|uniref:hypothetical protein n=1 Tax=Roseateles sp. NT4 TaxID=3453715 RepID=UPI003EEE8807
MIGAPLSSPASLFTTAASLRPLGAPSAPAPGGGPAWLDGLGAGGAATLRADVAIDQRGLSVQQHAERVLTALLG